MSVTDKFKHLHGKLLASNEVDATFSAYLKDGHIEIDAASRSDSPHLDMEFLIQALYFRLKSMVDEMGTADLPDPAKSWAINVCRAKPQSRTMRNSMAKETEQNHLYTIERVIPCYHPPIPGSYASPMGINWISADQAVCAVCGDPIAFDHDEDIPTPRTPLMKPVRYGNSLGAPGYVDGTIPADRRKTVQVILDVHPHIAILAWAMQRKLDRDHDKGNWDKLTTEQCMDGILREMAELREAAGADAFDEAADVANWAMFAAGVIRDGKRG